MAIKLLETREQKKDIKAAGNTGTKAVFLMF